MPRWLCCKMRCSSWEGCSADRRPQPRHVREPNGGGCPSGIRVSVRTLRHTCAVNYMKQGGDIYTLSLLLGLTAAH